MKKEYLTNQIVEFVRSSPLNSVPEINLERIFDVPILGVADARDPLFHQLKQPEVIGDRHCLPTDWLTEAKAVLSYFLPFTKEIRWANRLSGLPAIEWVYGRIEGEALNNALRKFIVELVNENGGMAIAPAIEPKFSVVNRLSNWSERHVAYVAGLGTFSLSKSFITEKGSAGRFGSVVTNYPMEPTSRNYSGIYDYCTMCGECIMRCPCGAINPNGKDNLICSHYIHDEIEALFKPRFGCGKCQTAVPCEFEKP